MEMIKNKEIKFLDFFAGIGGFRKGFEQAGMTCVGHCEIDKYAEKSYKAIHDLKESEWFGADITRVRGNELPAAELWCAGFPCQDISAAGQRVGLGGQRSSLFFEVIRLVRERGTSGGPKWLVFENVRNLLSINGGWDFARVLIALADLGYVTEYGVLNSKFFGVPQSRERVFIVARRYSGDRPEREIFPIEPPHDKPFGRPKNPPKLRTMTAEASALYTFCAVCKHKYDGGMCVKAIQAPDRKKTWSRKRIKNDGEPTFCLTTKDAVGVLLCDGKNMNVRKLTPREVFKLQAFTDEDFDKVKDFTSNTQAYKQAGNGVTVTVIKALGERIVEVENMKKGDEKCFTIQ